MRAAHPAADIEVWATDEHRLGLKPIRRPVWARRGQRPIARVQQRFEWLYLLALVHPASGRSEGQFASTINTAVMRVALATRNPPAAFAAVPTLATICSWLGT